MIRIDASLIDSHSDKERADGNFKGGYGFHPLLAFCDKGITYRDPRTTVADTIAALRG